MTRVRLPEIVRKAKYILIWAGRNWKIWVPLIASGVAIIVAIHANIISSRNSEIAYQLSKLDFRPLIQLNTLFNPVGKVPPHLTVRNIGPIEAVQVNIQMYSHRFLQTGKLGVTLRESTNDIFIEKLSPQKGKAFEFNNSWLNTNARLAIPVQNNVMEIRIIYRRPQDLKEYDESAFYFVNPNGVWVPETESSLNTDFYEALKAELFGTIIKDSLVYKEWGGDRLHPKETH